MPGNGTRYDDLQALFFNCTLKCSPERSNTQGLIEVSAAIMQKQGVAMEWDAGCRFDFENPEYR